MTINPPACAGGIVQNGTTWRQWRNDRGAVTAPCHTHFV